MARERFSFWLDLGKGSEFILADTIFELKQKRLFASTIRDGIRLIVDLRAGRVDVLLELFPFVEETLLKRAAPLNGVDLDTLQQFEQLIYHIRGVDSRIGAEVVSSTGGEIKKMKISSSGTEDEVLIVKKAKSNGNSAKNFLDAAYGLAGQ